MKLDLEAYSRRIISEYEKWAKDHLPEYLKQDATMQDGSSTPGEFMLARRTARLKKKAEKPGDIPSPGYGAAGSRQEDEKTLPVEKLVSDPQNPFVLLLADPGMGKTTLLHEKEKINVDSIIKGKRNIPLPVRHELNSYATLHGQGESLEKQLITRLKRYDLFPDEQPLPEFKDICDNIPLFIMLDGLNEVEGEPRKILVTQINSLRRILEKSPKTHFLCLTTRIHEGWEKIDGFNYAELHPLEWKTVEEYSGKTMRDAQGFLDDIKQKRLEPLASIPLFLFFMRRIYESPEEKDIPPNRGMILDRIVNSDYLSRYEGSEDKPQPPVDRDRCNKILEILSYDSLEKKSGVKISLQDLEQAVETLRKENSACAHLKTDEAIRSICLHGILEEHENGFSFWHPIFRDYFAGKKILSDWEELVEENLGGKLARDNRIRDYLEEKLKYTRWDEAFSIALGIGSGKAAQSMLDTISVFAPFAAAKFYADLKQGVGDDKDKLDTSSIYKKLERLSNKSLISIRKIEINSLAHIGSPVAVQALIKALEDEDVFVRLSAASALGDIGSPEAVTVLIKDMEDENTDKHVRESAASALGDIGTPEAVQALIKTLEDENIDKDVRGSAAFALGDIGSPEAVQELIKTLEDENKNVRELAARSLGNIGSPEAVPALLKALEDEDKDVRWLVASALGDIGSPEAVPALIKALEDKNIDKDVRWRAASALGDIRSPEALPALVKVLGDKDSDVRESVARAIGDISSSFAENEEEIEKLIRYLKKRTRFYYSKDMRDGAWMAIFEIERQVGVRILQKPRFFYRDWKHELKKIKDKLTLSNIAKFIQIVFLITVIFYALLKFSTSDFYSFLKDIIKSRYPFLTEFFNLLHNN